MGSFKWTIGYFNIFFKNLIDLWEKKSYEQYLLGTFLFYSGPPNQRIMDDVTTVFITETYHIYLWTNNSVFLKDVASRGYGDYLDDWRRHKRDRFTLQ